MRDELASTAVLVERYREGDLWARDTLVERYLPLLRRWARGRLPSYARSNAETDDLVQVTLLRALDNLGDFQVRHEGAFLAYLRRIFLNVVRDEIRRYGRSPGFEEVRPELGDGAPSAVERLLGREKLERYEEALAALPEEQREAVILRVEFEMPFEEIARALDRPSANAARMTVARALAGLAEQLDG
jgi:RNA polymerase sigma-70 factor (ECF subfamily)